MEPQDTIECPEPRITIFPKSSFFKEQRAPALPTPAEIKAIAEQISQETGIPSQEYRPRPIKFPSLGLVVKYGTGIRAIEAQTQLMVREKLHDQVPVPEVFGWVEDGDYVFIYMALVEGEMLEERWVSMNEDERISVCKELRHMAKAWVGLEQDADEQYIGSIGKQPLTDIFVVDQPKFVGPYEGPDAIQQFHDACHIYIETEDIRDEVIKFTHNDLVPPNIMVSSGMNPKVVAIIDWAQSGWYPGYWEYCKGRIVGGDPEKFSRELLDEWRAKYLPLILDPVDEEKIYIHFHQFVLSWGI